MHFKAVLKILCSVAGVSSCLISPPTNFNNDTVPHQHAKHVEPTNPSSFETQHPGINAFRLFFSTLFFSHFLLHRLITLIFLLSLKHRA